MLTTTPLSTGTMPRGSDRALLRSLAAGRWLDEHNNVLVCGPTGAGKSFVACALGNQAARDGHSVRYQRLSRLLD
jgi:DNA replication protein DnaC